MRRYILFILFLPIMLTCTQFVITTRSERNINSYPVEDIEVISGQPAMETAQSNYLPVDLPIQEDLGLYLYRNPITRDKIILYFTDLTGSREITDIILRYSDIYNLPLSLSFALADAESAFSPAAVNRNRSSIDRGLFQLNSRSFPYLKEKDFFNPETNARYGLKYLRECLEKGGNVIVGLAMYNAGTGRVTGQGTPKMTLDYIAKIIAFQKEINADIEASMVKNRIVNYTGKQKKTVKYVLDTGKYSK